MQYVDLTPIAVSVIAIFSALIALQIMPMIKEKLSKDQRENLYGWAVIAAKAAEQAFKSGKIDKDERREKALEFLREKGFDINLEEVDAALEAAVKDLPKTFVSD